MPDRLVTRYLKAYGYASADSSPSSREPVALIAATAGHARAPHRGLLRAGQQEEFTSNMMRAERIYNDRTWGGVQWHRIEDVYALRLIDLPGAELKAGEFEWVGSSGEAGIEDLLTRADGSVALPLHPEFASRLEVLASGLKGRLTSSDRTFLVQLPDGTTWFVKTPIQRDSLTEKKARISVAVSEALEWHVQHSGAPPSFAFLREPVALVGHRSELSDAAVVFRETRAYPDSGEPSGLVAFHALYSKNPRKPNRPTVMELLIAARPAGIPAAEYAVSKTIDPLLENWMWLALRAGLQHHSHSQNAMLEYSERSEPGRVVIRDLLDAVADQEIRPQPKTRGSEQIPELSGARRREIFSVQFRPNNLEKLAKEITRITGRPVSVQERIDRSFAPYEKEFGSRRDALIPGSR
jgi:hypothetical protein